MNRFVLSVLLLLVQGLRTPNDPDFAAIERLIGSGEYRQALQALQRNSSASARWHWLASKAFDGVNDPARAVEEAEAALALEPGNETHHLQLAQIFLTRNTPSAALEILSEAQTLFPDSLLIRLGKGLALKELQRYEEAEEELLECLKRKPGFGLAFDGLSAVYLNSKRYEAAERAAQRYIQETPDDFRGYYYRSAALNALKLQSQEARESVLRALRLKPDFAASHALLGKILLEGGQTEEAVEALKEAVRLRPDYSPALYHLATACRKLGRQAEADQAFKALSELKEKERQPRLSLRYGRGKK